MVWFYEWMCFFCFSLTLSRQASITGAGICAFLNLVYYSRGSEQRATVSNHKLGLPPIPASATPAVGLTQFEFHQYDWDNMVSRQKKTYLSKKINSYACRTGNADLVRKLQRRGSSLVRGNLLALKKSTQTDYCKDSSGVITSQKVARIRLWIISGSKFDLDWTSTDLNSV